MARKRGVKTVDLFAYAEDNRPSIVYMARNTKNGNLYIGVTRRSVEQRRKKHLGEAARGTPGRFYNAIRKHGPSSFEFTLLKECASYYDALAEEVAQIAALKPAYNVTRGGEGALGYKHDAKTLTRMRLAKLGKPGPWLGKKRSPETVAKLKAAKLAAPIRYWLGKRRDPETIAKILATKKQNGPPIITDAMRAASVINVQAAGRANRKRVICLNDGAVYESAVEAAKAYGLDGRAVASVCSGARGAIYGKRFAYLEKLDQPA